VPRRGRHHRESKRRRKRRRCSERKRKCSKGQGAFHISKVDKQHGQCMVHTRYIHYTTLLFISPSGLWLLVVSLSTLFLQVLYYSWAELRAGSSSREKVSCHWRHAQWLTLMFVVGWTGGCTTRHAIFFLSLSTVRVCKRAYTLADVITCHALARVWRWLFYG
jgi:hypothetical protein